MSPRGREKNRKMKKITLLLCLLLTVLFVKASPVFRVTKSVRQSDGKTLTITRTGANHVLYYVTTDCIPICPDDNGDFCYAEFDAYGNVSASKVLAHEAEERTPAEQEVAEAKKEAFFTYYSLLNRNRYGVGALNLASVSSIGDVRLPVVLAEFTDVAFRPENDIARFHRHLNAENYIEEGGAGSVRDYFMAQSYGQFRPYFDVLTKVKVSQPRAAYGANRYGDDVNPKGFIAEAVDSAIAHGVDFEPYKNSNGDIMVTIIYPGHGEQVSGSADCLWAAYYGNMAHTNKETGLRFAAGLVMDELANYGYGEQFDGIGTLCHEFSHALGLTDFYNTNGQSGIFGMSVWSLMDYGFYNDRSRTPQGYTAYEREFLGWLKIDTLFNEKQLVTLPPLHSDSVHVAYRIPNEADPTGNEYYILENHAESDWFLPDFGEGMLILHVDYLRSAWTGNTVNNTANHQRMTIIPADGVLTQVSGKASSYQGDLWPGYTNNTELNSTTTPCDTAYVGGYMNIRINNIRRDNLGNVVFFYQCNGQLDAVEALHTDSIGKNTLAVSWTAVDNADSYLLRLCRSADTLRIDTVSATEAHLTLSYGNLDMATDYQVVVKAVATDYLDSAETILSLKTAANPLGDVNDDGEVDAFDAAAVYSYIISGENSGILLENADVNDDGEVNSADIVAIYRIILNCAE